MLCCWLQLFPIIMALAAYGAQAPLLPLSLTTSTISFAPQTTSNSGSLRISLPQSPHNYPSTTTLRSLESIPEFCTNKYPLKPSLLQTALDTILSWLPDFGRVNDHSSSDEKKSLIESNLKRPGKTESFDENRLNFLPGVYEKSWNASTFWTSGNTRPEDWSDDERVMRKIPSFVFDYAPLVHLYSGEEFWPCDIAEHLLHTSPYLNYTPLENLHSRRNLSNLNNLNKFQRSMYLTSDDNVEDRPEWLGGRNNIPDPPVFVEAEIHPSSSRHRARSRRSSYAPNEQSGRSDAPAILIVVDKGNGVVDAFWFFFYSYNLGNKVLNVRFGNHVGDWEHTLIRFQDGEPDIVFFSEHYDGVGYSYPAVEKYGKRPIIYSARGTHAMYSTPGTQRYVLPFGLLFDLTDRGPLWDPLLNSHSYTYNISTDVFRSSHQTPRAPTEWLYFNGHWGDKAYPLTDSRQYIFAGQYHYVSGPLGPRQHQLGRERVCQGKGECHIRHWLSEKLEWRPGDNADEEGPPELGMGKQGGDV